MKALQCLMTGNTVPYQTCVEPVFVSVVDFIMPSSQCQQQLFLACELALYIVPL